MFAVYLTDVALGSYRFGSLIVALNPLFDESLIGALITDCSDKVCHQQLVILAILVANMSADLLVGLPFMEDTIKKIVQSMGASHFLVLREAPHNMV